MRASPHSYRDIDIADSPRTPRESSHARYKCAPGCISKDFPVNIVMHMQVNNAGACAPRMWLSKGLPTSHDVVNGAAVVPSGLSDRREPPEAERQRDISRVAPDEEVPPVKVTVLKVHFLLRNCHSQCHLAQVTTSYKVHCGRHRYIKPLYTLTSLCFHIVSLAVAWHDYNIIRTR